MWTDALNWVATNRIGDVASITGVVISVFGFIITMYGVTRSKEAALRAEEAAKSARDSIRLFDVVVDFTNAIGILDEIKRSHRHRQWEGLPDRYSTIRKILINLRSLSTELTDSQLSTIQGALSNLTALEKQVEKALATASAPSTPRINALLSDDIDRLYQVLTELKKAKTGG